MNKQQIALATLPLSLLFMVLAHYWPTSSPTLSGWTEEASKEHGEVSAKLHEMSYGVHSHGPPKPGEKKETPDEEKHRKEELEIYKKKFADGNARLELSRQSGPWMGRVFVYLSLITFCVGIGGIVYLSVLEQQGQK